MGGSGAEHVRHSGCRERAAVVRRDRREQAVDDDVRRHSLGLGLEVRQHAVAQHGVRDGLHVVR
jgi:hypothetical protein